jgi:hypothetical protein
MSLSHASPASENIPLVVRRRSRANSDGGIYRPINLKRRRLISSALLHTRTLSEVGQNLVLS